MDSLRSFMDEMLNDQGRKEGFISDLLGNLKKSAYSNIGTSSNWLYNNE